MTKLTGDFVVFDTIIWQDQDGYISLTDLWRLAGRVYNKRPGLWQTLPTTKELVTALTKNVKFFDLIAKTRTKSAIYTVRGRSGATFAHHILALAYAEYLNPDLGVEVRDIALRFWAGDVTLLDDFVKDRYEQYEEDMQRVVIRGELRWYNQELASHIRRRCGARSRGHFAGFQNSGYRGLYGGEDENAIHRRKGLQKDQAIPNHMSTPELAANLFTRTQTEQRLKYDDKYGPANTVEDACRVHYGTGKLVRRLMRIMRTPLPEDMPTVDSIGDAKRRILAYKKSLKKGVPLPAPTDDKEET